ncbi:GNAT family N-acetyltransferase [uncultured Pseudokineococcus sp.]|uniref:GNAT family N-acetyltransferase n=1 Tax=uncultured Pseudokineococcus sp. TaxID=1642928 RepID=UPI002620B9E3|nr:GNAT family N-acetyltransferase [uncultured Pseudokineococcus sp.]
MELRGRRDEDLPGAARLLARVHTADGYPSRWPEDPGAWLTPTGQRGAWVVAGEDGDVLGHVALVDRAPGRGLASDAPVEVVRLFVDPARRRCGVAALLLAAAVARADELGLDVDLQVVAASARAVTAYERLGWREVRRHAAAWTSASGEHPEVVRMVPPPRAGAGGRGAA